MLHTVFSKKNITTLLISLIITVTFTGFTMSAADRSGTVVETMDAASYTYLNIKNAVGTVWVAIPASEVKVGEKVTFSEGMEMQDFTSKSLGRTFPSIIFSPGLEGNQSTSFQGQAKQQNTSSSFADAVETENNRASSRTPQPQTSTGSAGATVPFLEISVEKAAGENSYTVAEVFENADSLDGKNIRIRGKVVKVSPNIMGKNWIHLQDGTGDPMQNSHDLVATSSETIEVDQIIVVEGVLAANKDFGFGYKYNAIVEKASLHKE